MNRITTGIQGLDEMLEGGLLEKSITTVIGPAGSGKTIFSLQMLYTNLKQGKNCIYINVAHSTAELLTHSYNFGWDLRPFLETRQLIIKIFQPVSMSFKGSKVQLISSFLDELPEYLYSHKAEVIILDSITEFLMLCKNDIERRSRVFNLFQIIKSNLSAGDMENPQMASIETPQVPDIKQDTTASSPITVFVTAESEIDSPHSRYGIVEFVTDGAITLSRIQSEELSELINILQISKMRWTNHSKETRQYEITDNGIVVHNPKSSRSQFKFYN
ncbi:MAG: hypothetical protein K8R25_15905 [Methanosarcinales archaeon]|nr:hypothetical protein [Methanosarcinales archaeon]